MQTRSQYSNGFKGLGSEFLPAPTVGEASRSP